MKRRGGIPIRGIEQLRCAGEAARPTAFLSRPSISASELTLVKSVSPSIRCGPSDQNEGWVELDFIRYRERRRSRANRARGEPGRRVRSAAIAAFSQWRYGRC